MTSQHGCGIQSLPRRRLRNFPVLSSFTHPPSSKTLAAPLVQEDSHGFLAALPCLTRLNFASGPLLCRLFPAFGAYFSHGLEPGQRSARLYSRTTNHGSRIY
jgi:hypothetical protein